VTLDQYLAKLRLRIRRLMVVLSGLCAETLACPGERWSTRRMAYGGQQLLRDYCTFKLTLTLMASTNVKLVLWQAQRLTERWSVFIATGVYTVGHSVGVFSVWLLQWNIFSSVDKMMLALLDEHFSAFEGFQRGGSLYRVLGHGTFWQGNAATWLSTVRSLMNVTLLQVYC